MTDLKVRGQEEFDDDSEVALIFRHAAGSDMEIDWQELQRILNAYFKRGETVIHLSYCLFDTILFI